MAPDLSTQRAELRERLGGAGLDADVFLGLARVGARLVALSDAPGRSRLGGLPELPFGSAWPEHDGRPLMFTARVDLDELAEVLPADDRQGLPASGDLWLFTDALGMAWGFRPEDRGSFVLIHTEGENPPLDAPAGRDDEGDPFDTVVVPRACRLVPELVLPDAFEDGVDLVDDDAAFDAYTDLDEHLNEEWFGDAPRHRILGRPTLVQQPMELEAQLASNGIDVGGPEGYASAEAKRLKAGAADWTLVAQIDSDDDTGFMWGDVGLVYWWMRRQDIAAGRWEGVWGILQCS